MAHDARDRHMMSRAFFGCHAALPPALRDIQKTAARETTHDVICEKKTREKDVVGIVKLTYLVCSPQITLLLILQWHTGVFEETFDVNRKIAQTTQNI